MSKYCFTKEVKVALIKFFQEESYTLNEVGRTFNVHPDTIKDWQTIIYILEKMALND